MFRSLTSVQFVPSQVSVSPTAVGSDVTPAKAIPAVVVPAHLKYSLAAFKLLTSVHEDPFQSSVSAVLVIPPAISSAVAVP